MDLREVFDHLAHGELSHLYLGNGGGSKIAECDYRKIVSHINLGLLGLYTYFPIKEAEVIIRQVDGVKNYLLDSKHAVSNEESTATKWIMDSELNPFKNDILKIEEVYRANNEAVPLNNPNDDRSFFTPVYNLIQIPEVHSEELLAVIYQARHPKIVVPNDNNIDGIDIELPDILIEPLCVYVHSRITAGIGSENSLNESLMLQQRYIEMLRDFRAREIMNRDSPTNIKLGNRGWV